MKTKTFTKTKAPLPESEKVVGGDIDKSMTRDQKLKFKKLFKNVKK